MPIKQPIFKKVKQNMTQVGGISHALERITDNTQDAREKNSHRLDFLVYGSERLRSFLRKTVGCGFKGPIVNITPVKIS